MTLFVPTRRPFLAPLLLLWLLSSCSFSQAQNTTETTAVPVTPAQDTRPPTSAPTATPWGGCVDPLNPDALVTIGKKTTICLVIADGVDWSAERTYMRLNYQPIADQYSRFHVPQSYTQLVVETNTRVTAIYAGKNITVNAESQTSLSFQRRYFDGFDKIYPYLTAIVDVKDGVVQGITWDNACLFCAKSACQPNTFDFAGMLSTESEAGQPVGGCYIDLETCDKYVTEKKTDCDLILYTVWTGTDANGAAFKSSASRFSAFPVQDLSNQFSQNLPTIELPKIPGVGSN